MGLEVEPGWGLPRATGITLRIRGRERTLKEKKKAEVSDNRAAHVMQHACP